ncbi:Auxin response factor [Rhynchospora pubera]|uniref:Auxin response factor n=1 Tax=Rhynchospora pubera TaxID=906938 RepID=A0AAV8BWQ7_9POAL|nr:Auxin response factor [Rhynchospora pubera]
MITFADALDPIQPIKDHEKSLDPQLWHACAGGMVQMPLVHSKVYFFPQGYMEHASNGTYLDLPITAARVPPLILCSVQSIKYLADSDSDEVYAKIQLVPIRAEEPEIAEEEDGFGSFEKDKPASFAKTLTQSDANNGGGFSVPRYCAETIFPRLDYSADPPVQTVLAKDVHGEIWKFRHIYRGTPRRHLLTTGWSTFVNQKKLVAGDSIVFLRVENGDLYVGIRRAKRGGIGAPDPLTPLPGYGNFCNPVREKGRIRVDSVVEAINLAVSGRSFEVIYYPRASTPEFVVRAGSVRSAMRVGWCPGMRFKMAFETEDSSRISWFMGTVNSVQVADPVRWPNSPWRLLQVTWDEPDLLQNVKRVSPWLVELVSTIPPIHLTPFSPASPMPPRKKPRIIPLEGQFPVLPSGFNGGPMFPFPEVAATATGIQGARHSAPFGISLPDLSLFNRSCSGPHHLLNSNGMAHHLNGGSHHFTVPSPMVTPTKDRDAVSCLLTLGTPDGLKRSEDASPKSNLSSDSHLSKSKLVLFGQAILTEEQISTSNNSGNTSDGSGSGSSVIIQNGSDTATGASIGHCKVFMESEDMGRTLELSYLGSYEELYDKLGQMFGLDKAGLASRVMYQNSSGEVRRTGEEPFGEFMKSTRRLTILTAGGSHGC